MEAQGTGDVEVHDVGALDEGAWGVVAGWCLKEWAHLFPADTPATYIEVFRWSTRPEASGLPIVLVALVDNVPVGTATLIANDELPDATEPGPWLAAVYVSPEARRHGIGARLVDAVVARATLLGFSALYCYTEHEDTARWYAAKGWLAIRESSINNHSVVVMRQTLASLSQ